MWFAYTSMYIISGIVIIHKTTFKKQGSMFDLTIILSYFLTTQKKKTFINICMYTCVDFIRCNFFIFKFHKSLFYIFNIKLSTQRIYLPANNNYNARPLILDFTTQPWYQLPFFFVELVL
jgi:hypothetical protein